MFSHPLRTGSVLCQLALLFAVCACNNQPASVQLSAVNKSKTTHSDDTVGEMHSAIIDLGLPTTRKVAESKVFPVDEGPLNADFVSFRSDLLRAVQAKDTAFIMQLVRPTSKISFGAEGGKMAFRIMWGLGEYADDSPLWKVLDDMLRMGGQFMEDDQNFFVAPYVYSAWPDHVDAFENAVITGANVRIRESPGLNSPVITSLSYDIVKTTGERTTESTTIDDASHPWYQIVLSDGREGWVFGQYIRSPIDFRIGLKGDKEGWYIAFFVAGD